MKKYILFPLIVLLLISCNSSKSSLSTIVIDLDNVEDIKLSDIVDSIKMVQLETTPECLMQHVSKTFIYNDRFYVFDSKQYVVFCFDKSGKFLFKIDNRGRGPQEYSYICDVELDKINNRLLFLDPNESSIFYFTLEGEFISKIKLSKEILAYNNLFLVGGDTLLFMSHSDNLVLYSQKTNNILKKYPFEYGVKEYGCFKHKIFKNRNNIRFVDGITNDINELDEKGDFIKIKSMNLGKYRIDTDEVAEYEREYKKMIKNVRLNEKRITTKSFSKYGDKLPIYRIFYVAETDRYFFAYFYSTIKEEVLICVTDKQLNNTKVVSSNIENISFISNRNGNSSDNIIVLSDVLSSVFYDRKCYNIDLLDAKNKAIVEAHTDDMNPMLALYYLKK